MYFDKIKALCDEKGISIFRLEKEAKIGNGTIDDYKTGSIPRITTLEKIAKYFDVPVSYFLEE